jgi:uncharacterized protein
MKNESNLTVNWREIAIFYTLAVLISAPFRLNWIVLQDIAPLPGGLNYAYMTLKALGPAAAFFTVVYVLRSRVRRTVSLWGRERITALTAFLSIPVCMAILGIANEKGLDPHYLGGIAGLSIVCYALLEEYGWRGYLQDALSPVGFWKKILIISLLWYVWHLNFLRPGVAVNAQLMHYVFVLAGTAGLYFIALRTRSLLVCTAGHALFNIFELGLPRQQAIAVTAFATAAIVVAMRTALRKQNMPEE